MKRNAFVMYLKPGMAAEYKKRHDAIWPELKAELSQAGISNYSIFFDPKTNYLFAYQELTDDNRADELAQRPTVQKWWHMMKDLMATNLDESPQSDPLTEVFHLD